MKQLKEILHTIRNKVSKTSKSQDTWFQSSKQNKDGQWINDNVRSVKDIVDCSDDNVFFNIWVKCTEDGAKELDHLIETELIPNGLRILDETEKLSKEGTAVRYMIARPLKAS
jgi:hypothetical protein|tara:strand:+ start:2634 stop:2972 length:339 start_codon:yes stop_codon:yes gene_type:complete